MKLLITADLHAKAAWYRWISRVSADYDGVVIAGDLLDMFRSHQRIQDDQLKIQDCLTEVEKSGVKVWLAEGNHDCVKWPWLQQRLGLRLEDTMVIYHQPWVVAPADFTHATTLGRQLASERHVPFVVIAHAPPANTPVACMAPTANDQGHHAVEVEPDYCICGHIHSAPFEACGSWYFRVGKTWIFNPGCEEKMDIPSHIVLDTTGREAIFFCSRKIQRIDLDSKNLDFDQGERA